GIQSISSTTRTEAGLQAQIATNITAVNTGLTEVTWQQILVTAFRYGSDTKVAFCSPTALAAIEGFARGRMEVVNSVADRFGVMMKRYVSGQGQVDLVA